MGMAEALGVDVFFKQDTWREAGEGLHLLATQPGRAAAVLGDEFKANVADPLRAAGFTREAVSNPSGPSGVALRNTLGSLASQAGQAVMDVGHRSTVGFQTLLAHPGASLQVIANSPRELGQVFGTATGVGLDMISGGSSAVVRGSTRVGTEVAGSLVQTALRTGPPNPSTVVDALTPDVPHPLLAGSVDELAAPLASTAQVPRHIDGASGPVSFRPGAAEVIDIDLRLGDIVGQTRLESSVTLPTGLAPSVIADQVAASAASYREFFSPVGPPGRVEVFMSDVPPVGAFVFGDVVRGTKGTFEFNFVPGAAVPSPAPPRPAGPLAQPVSQAAAAPHSSMVDFGRGQVFGDIHIGDVASGSIVSMGLNVPVAMTREPPVAAALAAFRETLSQHMEDWARVRSSVHIDMGHEDWGGPDVVIRDVARGNMLEVRINVPQNVTPDEAARSVQGVREGFEQLWAQWYSEQP
ncbi:MULTISPECIES: hypothetical protein [Myxococcus]|uniref:hypothetical protein n=1 Tax=Myxococcus TaxID=32 RepID=UPI00129C5E4C|nr:MULTISPECIES: hypothetical protein [Myxococcus]MCK8500192.1 hypothetical protein [Myxococcus fulvus]